MRFRRFGAAVITAFVLFLPTVGASPMLRQGSHGHDVLLLQQKLQSIGYTITVLDGVFGEQTQKAVENFQRDHKIKVTGTVSNSTWRELKTAKALPTKSKKTDSSLMPLDSSKAKRLIATAKKYIGTPYAFGGTTPSAFDCSGYLQYVFRENGINIPRTADEQYLMGISAKNKKDLVPGDLVFFSTYEEGASHVGIYLGDNQFIHASSSKGVRIDAMDNTYWQPRYVGGKRIVK